MTTPPAPLRAARDHERRYPGANKRATETVINLLRTESMVSTAITAHLRPFGLSIATFNVLMILEGSDTALCPYQIGDRLLVTRGTVTGLLDSLQKQGLIARRPHPEDRRMLQIELTPAGRALLAEVLVEHFPAEAEVVSALTAREKETLVRLLGKIQAHLTEAAADDDAPTVTAARAR